MRLIRSGVVATGLSLILAAGAWAQELDKQAITAELQALRSEVAQLRAERQKDWLTEQRAAEVKALVREVLADADTRASLLGGPVAGYDKKAFLADEAGKFRLNFGGRIQVRYISNWRNDPTTSDADEFEGGFQIRRVKLQLDGHIADPKFMYKIVFATNRDSDRVYVEEVSVAYELTALGMSHTIRGGRFKAPFLREELISSGKQLAVERSFVNERFTTGYTDGVSLECKPLSWLSVAIMLNDGQNAGEYSDTTLNEDFHNDASDIAGTARVEALVLGEWKQTEDFTAWSGEATMLLLGAAVHYEHLETGTAAGNNDRFLQWTGDVSFEWKNLSVFAAVIGRHYFGDEATAAGTNRNFDQFGALAQVSYLIVDRYEPFVRWEWFDGDGCQPGTITSAANNIGELLTFGVNIYFKKHDAKATIDFVWCLDGLPNSETGLGLLQDANFFKKDQKALRAQFQLQF